MYIKVISGFFIIYFKQLRIPFHCALSDESESTVHDSSIIKEVSSYSVLSSLCFRMDKE